MQATTADQIGQVIDKVAGKLRIPAEKLWEVGLQGMRIEGITDVVNTVVLGGLAFMSARYFISYCKKDYSSGGEDCLAVVTAIGSVICGILTMIALNAAIQELFAPRYVLLQRLVGK